jgi:amylosucrase
MTHVLGTHFPPAIPNATYATYIRCHDDIGWAVTDEDAGALGFSGPAHRAFLSDFYEGVFPGTFARGALFQYNPATGDKRISGTFASLAGLEAALAAGDPQLIDRAVDRILMGHALIAAWGGIPLVYMGDEIAMLNDWSYTTVPAHAHDSRWLHRPAMDWDRAVTAAAGGEAPEARVLAGVRAILKARAGVAEFHGAIPTEVRAAPAPGVFAFRRAAPWGSVLCLFNFTEDWRGVPADWAAAQGARTFVDALSGGAVDTSGGTVALPPYARVWLR